MSEDALNIPESLTRRWRVPAAATLAAALFATYLTVGNAIAMTPADEAATQLADDYVAALQTGDVDAIKALMTGPYLERHRRQLELDGYSHRLAELYGTSQHEVLRTQPLGDQGATVDVAIRTSDGEEYQWRLLLEQIGTDDVGAPIYRIVGEEEPSD